MNEPCEIVCCLALGDAQARYHVLPLALGLPGGKIRVVRHRPLPEPLPANIHQCIAPFRWRLCNQVWMAWRCWGLSRRREVRGFVSFNPFPYGLFVACAAIWSRKPFHLGWIGTDWHIRRHQGWGPLGRCLQHRADFITVSGSRMLEELRIDAGSRDRVQVLPHAIDVDRFPVVRPSTACYDILFVGRLVPVKRVDVLLRAVALLGPSRPGLRVAIAGEGPEAATLRQEAKRLRIESRVEFLGQVVDVPALLGQGRIFVMCSESEGLPFALIEALCSGLVPVVTPVGDIPTLIVEGETGRLTPVGDSAALAQALASLLDDPAEWWAIHRQAVKQRREWTLERAATVWRDWFDTFVKQPPTAD